MIKNLKSFYIVILGVLLTGANGFGQHQSDDNYFEMSKNIRIMSSIYNNINTYYVDEPIPGDLMKKGIDAMLKSLDPYTVYYAESDIEDYHFMTTGQYGGIGSLIKTKDDFVIISEPYEDSPAQKAGLKAGDKLIEIDGISIVGKNSKDMSPILKGAAGTTLKVKYQRGEEFGEVTITREEIKVPDVPYYSMIDDEIGYVKLSSFTATASMSVAKALHELRDSSGMKKLIFDLRGNGGGLLHEAVNIVNFFVPKGQLVVSTKGRIPELNHDYKTKNNPFDLDIPVVVLVDDRSASASEIVSGSLQDLDRGVIVGMNTYGKGLVQQTKDINFGSKVKLTVAKYYTPSGRCIQKLDYSHRDDKGKVHQVADSLLATFKTTNGRKVVEGRGVDPDVKIDPGMYSKLTAVLVMQDYIFDYATEYERTHESIKNAADYRLTDAEYDAFITQLSDEDIKYTTDSEELLEKLKEVAKEEKYFQDSEAEFDELLKKLHPNLKSDMIRYKDEIIELIENEIVSRYYYQDGRVEASLKKDPFMQEAISVLNQESRLSNILTGDIK